MVSIAISSVLITLMLCVSAIIVAALKYRESAELGTVLAEVVALRKEVKSLNTKDVNDRLVALESRAGVRMF